MPKNAPSLDIHNLPRLLKLSPGLAAFVAVYIAILIWFKEVDIYQKGFSTPGVLTALYNVCRVTYIFYLFWIVYQVGNFLLVFVASAKWKEIKGVDRIAIGFFAGTGVCHAILLLLGYLNLYTFSIAVAITLPLVAFAYSDAAASFNMTRLAIADWYVHRNLQGWLFALSIAIALFVGIALLLVKGLYPAGGHDYFLHYFSYYKSVIDRGGIWPTAHYVHGYDSKGDGLVFLSMLLTDSIAHQLVTFCFIAAGALALHQLLSRIAPATLWPLVGVILYLSLYIYTPGMDEALSNGGWGDFEKWHEFETPLTIAILWLVASCFDTTGGMRLLMLAAASSAVVAAVIIDYTFSIYLGLVFTVLGAIYFALRRWLNGWTCIALATIAGTVLTAMIATNYLTTGLFGDIGIVAWWRFTNVDRLYQAGTLLQALNDYWSRQTLTRMPVLSIETFRLMAYWLRLELLYPLAAIGAVVAAVALIFRRSSLPPTHQATILAGAAIAYLIFALIVGRNGSEEISFARYSSFTLPIVIAVGVTLWVVADVSLSTGLIRSVLHFLVPVAVLAGCWSAAFAVYPTGNFSPILVNAARFAFGGLSIDDAYTGQAHWPGRLPWGGIYPGARGAYSVVGPHARVWSFHIHSYCMLPDCDLDVFRYVSMTGHDERVLFGTPEEARSVLQKAGLNYFLFSNELDIGDPVVGAPLFAPDNIAKYFGLRWTDGTTSLLTWIGPDTSPLSNNWIATYCHAVLRSPSGFYWGAMRHVFEDLYSRPHPWGGLDLPWAGNRPFRSVTEPGAPQFKCPPYPIQIVSATYGQSCRAFDPKPPAKNLFREENVTSDVRKACVDSTVESRKCSFLIDDMRWDDPAPGCQKDFSVSYRCDPGEPARTTVTAAPAAGKTIKLDCNIPPPSGLTVRSATYGGNCGATQGNATQDLASNCDGKTVCEYPVNTTQLSDLAPDCNKEFVASYSCAPDATILRTALPAEEGLNKILSLSCLREPTYNATLLPHLSVGQTLEMSNEQSNTALLAGWSDLEHWSSPHQTGAWSNGPTAYVGIMIQGTPAPKQVIVHGSVFFVPRKLEEQRVQVWSAGKKLAEFDLRDSSVRGGSVDLPISLSEVTAHDNTPLILGFYFPDAKPANQVAPTSDRRTLGLFLSSIQLKP